MKRFLIIIWMMVLASAAHAQTFAEWFQQKKTQKKYLIRQIAALQVYIGYLQKGYKIAKDGLNTIGDFTQGEFNLHTDYFNSLKSVNPNVKRYAKVAGIITLQVKIVQNYNRAIKQLKSSAAFSGDELSYIGKVFSNLLDDCAGTLDELIAVTADGKLEMKDDERLKRIDKLYSDMQDEFTFSRSFGDDAKTLAASRLQEESDMQTLRALTGIKNE
ncbi:hypothetical protein [Parafilimonas sp.]|uniref:hypothetical protein n=1 Tax=Parafilimonas sp. TaxID=1969739 RepID=UPI0039E64CED